MTAGSSNASFTDYLMPTALDMPPVESVLIEEPEPDAPYGVKGVGEPPTVVSTAAVVAALRDATGKPLNARARPARRDLSARTADASVRDGRASLGERHARAPRRGSRPRPRRAGSPRRTAICHVTPSSRKRTPSRIATTGFT